LNVDINKVKIKPYIEMKDYDESIPDKVVSQDFWEAMTNREQSKITELFYGQYKSKVSCVECGGSSVKADAFASLSLDIPPIKQDCMVRVVRIGGIGSIATDRLEVCMSLGTWATLEYVTKELSKMLGFDGSEDTYLQPFSVHGNRIEQYKELADDTPFCRLSRIVVL
jgi:hypothetical protein